jgi:hypothetical protein
MFLIKEIEKIAKKKTRYTEGGYLAYLIKFVYPKNNLQQEITSIIINDIFLK